MFYSNVYVKQIGKRLTTTTNYYSYCYITLPFHS